MLGVVRRHSPRAGLGRRATVGYSFHGAPSRRIGSSSSPAPQQRPRRTSLGPDARGRRSMHCACYLSAVNSTRISHRVNAPCAIVYRALLDARAVATWRVPTGMTSHVHEFDAREGGSFRVSLTYDART